MIPRACRHLYYRRTKSFSSPGYLGRLSRGEANKRIGSGKEVGKVIWGVLLAVGLVPWLFELREEQWAMERLADVTAVSKGLEKERDLN